MMAVERKRRGKIIGWIAAAVVLAGAISVGVMAALGVFHNPRTDAYELLGQIPGKLAQSPWDEYLGTDKMIGSMSEKGSDVELVLENIKVSDEFGGLLGAGMDKKVADIFLHLSDYLLDVGIQVDPDQAKTRCTASVAKDDVRLNVDYYEDEDSVHFMYPELLPGKVLVQNKTEADVAYPEAQMNEARREIPGFLARECVKLWNDVDCQKVRGEREAYELTVPVDTLVQAADDFVDYISEYDEIIAFYERNGGSDVKGENWADEHKKAIESESKEWKDIHVFVYGEKKELTAVKISEDQVECVLEFIGGETDGEEGSSGVHLNLFVDDWEYVDIFWENKKTDVCQSSLDIAAEGKAFSNTGISVQTQWTFDPSDYSFDVDVTAAITGESAATTAKTAVATSAEEDGSSADAFGVLPQQNVNVLDLTCRGTVKDLKPGTSLTYGVDELTVGGNGTEVLTLSAELRQSVLDHAVKPPEGEEISELSTTDSLKLYGNLAVLLERLKLSYLYDTWGYRDGFGL